MVRVAALTLCLCFSAALEEAAAAARILGSILPATEQHPDPSPPRGFPCVPASDLPAADILAFAQGLQNGTAELSGAQLSCLARLLAAKNLTGDFGRYPPDLLLFFDPAEVPVGTCRDFYTRAARGNLELLPGGSARRRGLLRGALGCLGVQSSRLRPEQLSSLGGLVCDMDPESITASDPCVLENLKLCPALTGTQRDALNAVLLGGGTAYGDPSRWDLQTLQSLGPLVLALNQTTLSLVPEAAREAFGRSIAATYSSQRRSQREKSLTLLRAFAAPSASSHPRLRRGADCCLSAPITATTVPDPLLLLSYDTSEQFDLCLSNEVVEANLEPLLEQPLPVDYLWVVKKKLEQIYLLGMPEELLALLGPLSRQYTATEISLWPVTSSSTLVALLNPADGTWGAAQVQQLLSRYLALGGTLTGPLLWKIGGRNLCNAQEEQIDQISPEAIRRAGPLDISSCSQTKKDQLYRKAQEAFVGQAGGTRAYYCRIRPYLGGAPAEDLKDLAGAGVAIDMDMDTFLALNPDELQKLSVMDVKNLLGENLPYLKEAENETSVMRWVQRQSQRELDCALGIGLQGGTGEPSPTGTATPPHPTTSASVTPTATSPMGTATPPHPTTSASVNPMATSPTGTATPPHPTTSASVTPTATSPVGMATPPHPTTLASVTPMATVPPPTAISSHPATNSSPTAPRTPTPSAISPAPPNTGAPSAAGSPPATSTTHPAPATGPIVPCPIHQSVTPNKATPLAVTLLAPVSPNATSPSSVPPPAVTHGATTTGVVTNPGVTTHNASTPLVSLRPPAPGGATNPAPATGNTPTLSTHSAPSTLVPNATSATERNKPTPSPNSTVPTPESVTSSMAKTPLPCETTAPPAFSSPSSTTTSNETMGTPEPPRPTPAGYINLQPEAGSGSRLCSHLLPVLVTAVGTSLLRGLL